MTDPTLPGRECGDCIACCVHKPIVSDGLVKAPNVICPHCTGTACGVYDARPTDCRQYLCAWKYSPWIPETMRPDRSGLLIDRSRADAPPGYPEVVTIMALRDPEDLARGPAPNLIASLIEDGVAVNLARPGPPGMNIAAGLANDVLRDAIRLRKLPLFLDRLRAIVRQLDAHTWAPWRTPGG